jgi:mannose-6-phosphate isomerase
MLDVDPDGRPWAELWFGTHIGGASKVVSVGGDPNDGHRTHPDDTNGLSRPLSAVSGELPYLLKILAAARPLSLQTHPDESQAREGFARENRDQIPIGSSRRIYRDPFPKPELLCALGRFEALCGFRREIDTVELLNSIGDGASELARIVADEGVNYSVHLLFSGSQEATRLIESLIEACRSSELPEARWVCALADSYPGDPAVAVTILLNYVVLEPGQALFLGPGNLHAYLRGTGVEVMGASDNVVRCGLTNKHVDVDQMLATIVTEPLENPVLSPTLAATTSTGKLWKFETPGAPFTLWMHQIRGAETLIAPTRELALCGVGSTDLLRRGEVCYLSPGEEVTLDGRATIFRVTEGRS